MKTLDDDKDDDDDDDDDDVDDDDDDDDDTNGNEHPSIERESITVVANRKLRKQLEKLKNDFWKYCTRIWVSILPNMIVI